VVVARRQAGELPIIRPLLRRGWPGAENPAPATNFLTRWSFADANEAGAQGVSDVTGCDKECLKMQSEAAHKHRSGCR
jgi:hypothetical protein